MSIVILITNLMISIRGWKVVFIAMLRSKKLNKKQMNKLSKPWINDSILKMIKHRDKLFQEKKDYPSNFFIKGT